MDFTYGSAFIVDSPDAYETLLLDALLGDAALFTRSDEVEKAWSIVTPILEAWAAQPAPDFPNYDAGSWGPPAADSLLAEDGRRWRRI
jgi:glucose-6-phosphate 1-dehydrogenase